MVIFTSLVILGQFPPSVRSYQENKFTLRFGIIYEKLPVYFLSVSLWRKCIGAL